MKTMKKHLSILLVAVLLLTLLPVTAFAADEMLTVGADETYKTIQAAVDAIKYDEPGIKTILIKAGTYDEEVTILQRENIDIVLQGEDGTIFTGNIIIDGEGRNKGNDKLTIRNIKFDQSGKDTPVAYIIDMKEFKDDPKRQSYTHNVTIEDCTFVGKGDPAFETFAINAGISKSPAYNTVIRNCTFSNLDCAVQARSQGLTLENVVATDMKSGINTTNSANISLKNVKIDAREYALRVGEKAGNAPFGTIKIENCMLSSSSTLPSNDAGAIVVRTSAQGQIQINSSDIIGHVFSSTPNITIETYDVYWGKGTTFTGFENSQLDIQNNANKPHSLSTEGNTEVKASADVTYTVVIPTSVDFGKINRKMDKQTRDFVVSVEDALIEAGANITVKNATSPKDMVMKDQTGTKKLAFTLDQPDGLFKFKQKDLADGQESIKSSVSCNPSELQAAGSYKGYMTFEINYNNK